MSNFSEKEALNALLGQHSGVVNVVDTTEVAGNFYAITILTTAVFSKLTEGATGSIATLSVPAGLTLYGSFTAVKLTSGAVRCYSK